MLSLPYDCSNALGSHLHYQNWAEGATIITIMETGWDVFPPMHGDMLSWRSLMSNNNLLLAFPHMLNYLKFRSGNYRAEMVSMRHAKAAMIMPATVTPEDSSCVDYVCVCESH